MLGQNHFLFFKFIDRFITKISHLQMRLKHDCPSKESKYLTVIAWQECCQFLDKEIERWELREPD